MAPMSTAPGIRRLSPFVELDRLTWSRLSDEIELPLDALAGAAA